MSPWYWAPISLAVLGIARLAYLAYWDEDYGYGPAGILILAATAWATWLGISHEPASWSGPAPAATRVCTAQALEQVYSPALKHTVPTWVCTGWSEQ